MNKTLKKNTSTFGPENTFIRAVLVILLRAGFILIQIGTVPVTDVSLILLQNTLDIACDTIFYATVGFIFAFGNDVHGIIGNSTWIGDEKADLDEALMGWCTIIIATGIFTTLVAGRMHGAGHIIVTFLFAAFIQPLFIHWTRTKNGWMKNNTINEHRVSFKDTGGGSLIHMTGGILGLCGGSVLGRRILLVRDLDESSIPPDSPGMAATGYAFLMIGLMAICLPTPAYEETHSSFNYFGTIILNNIMAASGGIVVVVILLRILDNKTFDYWIIIRCMQGAIAGMVSIAAGIDVYNPFVSLGVSVIAGLFFFFGAEITLSSVLEDYANIVVIHFVCGFIGTLLEPLFSTRLHYPKDPSTTTVSDFGWQTACCFALLGIMLIFALPLFYLLDCLGILRNSSETKNHKQAMIALGKNPNLSRWQKIFKGNGDDQSLLQPGYRTKREATTKDEEHMTSTSEKTSIPTVVALKASPSSTTK